MLRHALLLAPCLLAGCASTAVHARYESAQVDAAQVGATLNEPAQQGPALNAPATPHASTSAATSDLDLNASLDYAMLADESTGLDALALQQQPPPPPPGARPAPAPMPVRHYYGRVTVKGGYYGSDEDALDDGWIAGVSWMQFLSPAFATEFEIGYLDVDGKDGAVSTDVWGLPIMFNGRFTLPLGRRFEAFGGAGFGTIYFEGEADGPFVNVDADGWLTAGDLFAGAGLNLQNAMTLGVEWKWYFTDSNSGLDSGLDANAVLVTLGFNR